jgi:hypothetical protein
LGNWTHNLEIGSGMAVFAADARRKFKKWSPEAHIADSKKVEENVKESLPIKA